MRCWVDVPPHRTTIEALGACCHGPIAHTPGCVLHMLYYVYYVVLNITWTYSSANDLTYHAVVLFPKRTWYSCCTNCTIDCGMSYVFTNTSCCIVLLLQWLPLMSLPLHHRLQHHRSTSASKVRCWVAVHVPEVCVQNGEFCSNAGSLNHSVKCDKYMYVLCEFKNTLCEVKVSPNYFVHALSHIFG